MDSADSTALATKTVKHGAPPTEKTTPTTVPATQAAGRAALSRHMTSQKPGANTPAFTRLPGRSVLEATFQLCFNFKMFRAGLYYKHFQ